MWLHSSAFCAILSTDGQLLSAGAQQEAEHRGDKAEEPGSGAAERHTAVATAAAQGAHSAAGAACTHQAAGDGPHA